ncbi:undecaprenyl-diphosphate phosphatase [Paenibacillus shenyangensis]|uniref:undecaprenyl-diphosphate phosphatase n=1 Tax=Paenibacillus sp. A9 TaxID=1284352 RepID=UPI0003749A3D|nr:undecaprenyl-diphosphate phosphatase [Paenibacillus sp. A9]
MDFILTVLKYLFLGALQGFTEPIPISSSGHVVLVQKLLGLEIEGLSFETFVNTASLLAVLIVFREDIRRLIRSTWAYITRQASTDNEQRTEQKSDFLFVIYLVLGTIPAGVIGVLFNDYISEHLKGVHIVGYSLAVTAIALFVIRNMRGRKNDAQLSWKDAIIVGLGQAVALIPGISRSGATIVTAMLIGMKQETALRFSFLLYIPISLGGAILELPDLLAMEWTPVLIVSYAVAFVASFVASFYALKWFINIMKNGKLVYFSAYCLLLALCILIFL